MATATATLRKQEGLGLIVALAAHAGLIAWLALWKPVPEPVDPPQSVSVTLAEDVGLVATSPNPSADPAPATAPMEGDSLPPPAPEPIPSPEVRPVSPPPTRMVPTPPRPVPKPVTRPTPKRDPIADLLERRPAPAARPSGPPQRRPGPAPSGRPTGRPGGPQFGEVFKGGIPGATGAGGPPAVFGPKEQTALRATIGAKVRGPWNACSVTGLDVNKLRARVTFAMDKAGRVTGVNAPEVTGINDANRAQAARFGECAVKAIRTAAPYSNLPPELYEHWKNYTLTFRKEAI